MTTAITDNGGYTEGSFVGRLVLPYPNDEPACLREKLVDSCIALLVAADLGSPVGAVGGYVCSVLGTPMPEASVHEDGHLGRPEYEVSSHTNACQRACADPVSQTQRMYRRTQSQLRLGVPTAVTLHDCPNRWSGSPWFVGRHDETLAWLRPPWVGLILGQDGPRGCPRGAGWMRGMGMGGSDGNGRGDDHCGAWRDYCDI
jgi:hypothetical protein